MVSTDRQSWCRRRLPSPESFVAAGDNSALRGGDLMSITSDAWTMEMPSDPKRPDVGGPPLVHPINKSRRLMVNRKNGRWTLKRLGAIGVGVLVLIGIASWGRHGWSELGSPAQPLIFYTVARNDLPITVTERGNLESQTNTEVRCEVETMPGQSGTRIVTLVPNGTAVQEGELLVEFDSAPIKDRVDSQVLAF